MKTAIVTLLIVFFTGCSSDSTKQDQKFQLPPETQVGANTFGVTINGKVYIPRDPTGIDVGPISHGMIFWKSPFDINTYDELEVKDGASAVGFKMYIHFEPLTNTGKIILKQSNFHNGIDSSLYTHIFFKIWDNSISNYAYYGSVENEGEINITLNDTINRIVSGNFKGKFVRYDNPDDFINITDGRFDINRLTLMNNIFP